MATEIEQRVVRFEERDGVGCITLARPPANALGDPVVEGLGEALDAIAQGGAKTIVVCSEVEGFFAAGADIKQMAGLDYRGFTRYRDALRATLDRLATCGLPSIAAIDGRALGGGLELAMACTLRFATPRSRLGLPEVKLGLIPGAGGTQRLPRLVGRGRALEMMLSGEEIDAREARAIGLVDRVISDDVVGAAVDYAGRLAQFSAPAMEAIIKCVDAAALIPHLGMELEGDMVARLFDNGAQDGLSRFLEQRRASG